MTTFEKQILINQATMMNALTGILTLIHLDGDPILKVQTGHDEVQKVYESTIIALSKCALKTEALIKAGEKK